VDVKYRESEVGGNTASKPVSPKHPVESGESPFGAKEKVFGKRKSGVGESMWARRSPPGYSLELVEIPSGGRAKVPEERKSRVGKGMRRNPRRRSLRSNWRESVGREGESWV